MSLNMLKFSILVHMKQLLVEVEEDIAAKLEAATPGRTRSVGRTGWRRSDDGWCSC
jgi:hypothetical protein